MSDSLLNTETDAPSNDILTALWYFFTSSRWAALLLAVLALTVVLVAVLLRLAEAERLPAALEQASSLTFHGVETQPSLLIDGMFSFYGMLWMRLLLALLAFTLLLRLADRWSPLFHLRQHISESRDFYFQKQALCAEDIQQLMAENDIRESVRGLPGSRLARVWTVNQESGVVLYAENLRVAVLGDWLLHLGLLAVVVGLFTTAQWAWHEDNIALAAGETYELDHVPGCVLAMGSSQEQFKAGDMTLSLISPGSETREAELFPRKPELTSQFGVFQLGMGPALSLSARDATGRALLLQPFIEGENPSEEVTLKFQEAQGEVHLFVPNPGITLRIVRYRSLPEEGFKQPVYLIRAYRGTQSSPLFTENVSEDRTFEWQGLAFEATLENYIVLNTAQDWGWWFVLGGIVLVIAGSVMGRWPVPWLIRFQARRHDQEPCAFEHVTVWGHRDPLGRNVASIRACWQCADDLEVSDR